MKRILVVLALLAVAGTAAFAQTDTASHQVTMNVVAVAAIDLNDVTLITLNTIPPVNGGDPPTGDTNTTKRLWYTGVNAVGMNRKITVNWGGVDAAPAGTSLSVVASSVEGGAGTAAAAVTITAVAQDLVTAIPSVATGRLITDGAALTYSFNVVTPASLVVGATSTVTITFTLTDDIF